jgi:hypothetical protein
VRNGRSARKRIVVLLGRQVLCALSGSIALRSTFHNIVLLFTFADFCAAKSLTPAEALDRYLEVGRQAIWIFRR